MIETLPTCSAMIRFLSSVDPLMSFQKLKILFVCGTLPTLRAGERFLGSSFL